MKNFCTVVSLFACTVFYAQIVSIPDANFKHALTSTNCILDDADGLPVGDVDTNDDGEIQVSEALAVNYLDISSQNIASLSGIEAFSHLHQLNCSYNNLTSLVINSNYGWLMLDCSYNELTSLTGNINSTEMQTSYIDCSHNLLTSFDMTGNNFDYINCGYNQLTSFATSAHTYGLDLSGNLFTTYVDQIGAKYLGLSNCPLLTTAKIWYGGDGTTISNNPQLVSLQIGPEGAFEVHNNPVLASIDMKDGGVGLLTGDMDDPHYDFHNNPVLQFVCVDDAGNWYNEGGDDFFEAEQDGVEVSAGVGITFYCDLTPGGGFNTINGTVHYDCAGSNVGLNSSNVSLNLDSSSAAGTVNAVATPDNSGNYVFYGLGSGTVTPTTGNNYWTFSPANAPYSFSGTGNTQTADFCLSANGTHPDLDITIIPVVPARPGFDAVYKVHYRNKGTETASGSVSFNFDDNLSDAVSSVPAPDIQNTGSLSWNFSGLAPFESREITVTLNVNSPVESPAVNVGDVLTLSAAANSGSDETPADNTFNYLQTVVGSIDPNDKAVSRAVIGTAQLDQYLYYTVRFQNTGTYAAGQVVIRDMLSANLDVASLQVVSSSHPVRARMDDTARKAEFIFENIDLSDAASNESASHGYVTYRIKPKSSLIAGDVISNNAGIYFDYNNPVMTNTVTTTVTALANASFTSDAFSVVPNPTAGNVTIKLPGISNVSRVSVFNSLGQIVQNFKPAFENGEMTLDVGALRSGTYLLQVQSDNGTSTQKLVKW